jgi:IS5 family transposase
MYTKMSKQIHLTDYMMESTFKINPDNRWVRKAKLIPWDTFENKYENMFRKKGKPSKTVRMALGSLLIKEEFGVSDEETVQQIIENPYLQYFIGITEFVDKKPFDPSLMTWFRKRLNPKVLNEINEMICKEQVEKSIEEEQKEETNCEKEEKGDDNNEPPKGGTLVIDASCTPADITYPTDTGLLNKAIEITEEIIDELHSPNIGKKKRPRTYRKKARDLYRIFTKKRKPGKKEIRKCKRKQLALLRRNLRFIEEMFVSRDQLNEKRQNEIITIQKLFTQQEWMYLNNRNSVEDRIVSLSQPHVRPIVRGKAGARVEFGAKIEISIVSGFAFMEKLSWDNFNEGTKLKESVEKYKERFGVYPKAVLADTLYRNRENRKYCKDLGIRLSGKPLGRPKLEEIQKQKTQAYQDSSKRNCVEGKFGEGKLKYGWKRVKARLKETSETAISITLLTMNINKRLRDLLYTLFEVIEVFIIKRNKLRLEMCCDIKC